MATKAKRKSTILAECTRSGPATLPEALERLRPAINDPHNSPQSVASRLNRQHQDNEVYLLANGNKVPPSANPTMLTIVAHAWPDGNAFLYVRMHAAGGKSAMWDGQLVENLAALDREEREQLARSLMQHHQFWT